MTHEATTELSIEVCESITSKSTGWGLSLNGCNPDYEDYFPMDKETAFRLKERLLAVMPPIAFHKPLTSPSDKP
ncbi:MAG TPA: hypothetical protein VG367_08835 [Mucilaginibacter sp.]|jgi:hypothetical protein|nr:hypothetical protein [Mucilaginibacter sp.]